jgi:hypothetical protein
MAVALVVSAPQNKVDTATETPSFDQILATEVGPGYAISDADRRKISIDSKVIILDKYRRKRAEAVIVVCKLVGKTNTGMPRYDVHFKNAQLTDYHDERLERWGTSVIDLP